jgi:hypothetical protein
LDASELKAVVDSGYLGSLQHRRILGPAPENRTEESTSFPPDIVFLDPMFSTWTTGKGATSKKESQFLQSICDFDGHSDRIEQTANVEGDEGPLEEETQNLLELASCLARERIVVKLPRKKSNLGLRRKGGTHRPSFSVVGKSVRFDVFLMKNLP